MAKATRAKRPTSHVEPATGPRPVRVIRTPRARITVRLSARQWRHVLNVIVSQAVHCSPCGGASDALRDTFRVPDSGQEFVTISYTPADESEATA